MPTTVGLSAASAVSVTSVRAAAGQQRLPLAAEDAKQRPVREQAVQRAALQLQTQAGHVQLRAAAAAVTAHALRAAVRVQIIQPPAALGQKLRRTVGNEQSAVARDVVDDLIAHEGAAAVGVQAAAIIVVLDQARTAARVAVGHCLGLGVGEGRGKERKARFHAAGRLRRDKAGHR